MKFLLAAIMLAAAAGSAAATDLPPSTGGANAGNPPKQCRWVSNCQACTRVAGKLVCSNVGIACQPTKQRCIPE